MKPALMIFSVLSMMMLVACSESLPTGAASEHARTPDATVAAKRPLVGWNESYFNPGFFSDPTKPTWYGTITFDDTVVGVVCYGAGPPVFSGPVGHFAETFEVYSWIDFDPDTQTLETGDLLFAGHDSGTQDPTGTFHPIAWIDEAYGMFAGYEGRRATGYADVILDDATGMPYFTSGKFVLQ